MLGRANPEDSRSFGYPWKLQILVSLKRSQVATKSAPNTSKADVRPCRFAIVGIISAIFYSSTWCPLQVLLSNARFCWSNKHQQQTITNLKFPAANLWINGFKGVFPRQKVWTVTRYVMGVGEHIFWAETRQGRSLFLVQLFWWIFRSLGDLFLRSFCGVIL